MVVKIKIMGYDNGFILQNENCSEVRIAFIDTEVGVDSKKVLDYGAVREDGAVMHTQSAQEFNKVPQ